eukprot:CAMPEP_0183427678 /NCGR_PEP_ID=MMETSP0370-20130417/43214_1 /TAXON_ID=268820 /ORGANISM="Peridinium aciculiferum, Strain PAER-2" /LENGTH=140 /DNA_ID=CAMNT_0025612301 /DNA_START=82 /DNA_END=504 /DNA_ORIENTATION=-
MAPASLIWECVKGHTSFIRKSVNCKVMSAEPGNLCGLHSYKFSGLTGKVLNVSGSKKGTKESIVMTTAHKQASRDARPGSRLLQTGLKKSSKKGQAQLTKALEGGFYRQDLAAMAAAKYIKVKTSFKKKKLSFKSRRASK